MMKQGPGSSSGGDQSNVDHVSSGTCEDDEENEEEEPDEDYDEIEDTKPQPLPTPTSGSVSELSPSDPWHHGNVGAEGRLPVESPRPVSQSMHMPLNHQLGYQQQQQQPQQALSTIQRRQDDDGSPSPSYNNRNSLDSVQSSAMQHYAGGWLPTAPLSGSGHFQQHPFYGNEFSAPAYGASPPAPHQALFQPYSWYSTPGPVQQSVAAQQTLLT